MVICNGNVMVVMILKSLFAACFKLCKLSCMLMCAGASVCVCVCACACTLGIVYMDKILHFINTFIIIIL